VWVYDFLCLRGYDVTFPFLFTEYKMLTIASITEERNRAASHHVRKGTRGVLDVARLLDDSVSQLID
jgi:hypothetical protein